MKTTINKLQQLPRLILTITLFSILAACGVVSIATNDASLSSLTLSAGNLSPAFTKDVTDYTLTTTEETTTLTPIVSDTKATVKVNGTATNSGSASAPINLNVGDNTITLIVTAADGTTTQTYSIKVTRIELSTDASLSSLMFSAGSLSPVFASNVTDYILTTTEETTTLIPIVSDTKATVKVNGITSNSGSASAPIDLIVGDNSIILTVTAADGATQTYSIKVTRIELSTDANLSSLALSAGSLNPVFTSNVTDYTLTTKEETTTVTLSVNHAIATVTVNGTATNSGSASAPIDLIVGDNTITLIVTAEDATTKTYSITVTRTALSTDANLSSLALSAGSLNPVFTSNVTDYTLTTKEETTTVTLSVNHAIATVTVNGTATNSGSASAPIDLIVGDNTIILTVTAADGTTTQTYSIKVTRIELSTDANLSSLMFSAGSLSPVFASGVTDYTLSTNASTTTLTPIVSQANATVTVNGTATNSGSASAPIDLIVGDNTITLIVTAADGTTTQTYSIKVTRIELSTDANLSSLMFSAGSLSPVFASNITDYTLTTKTSSTALISIVSDANATVTVNGTATNSGSASAPINLTVGDNTITLIVTAADGETKKAYSITVTRIELSTDANLSSLVLSAGSLNPAFASDVTDYTLTATAETTTVTPITSQVEATVEVNNIATNSGVASTPITLAAGETIINIPVTAPDGSTTKTYTITVRRLVALELVDPNATAGRKFGEKVVQLSNGNIIVQVPTHAIGDNANVGAVHLYKPTSGTAFKSFYGIKAGDNLASGGIIPLANSNFLIVSPDEDKGTLDAVGSVKLVNGETGNIIKTITGNSENDQLASKGITLLNDNQFVITSPNYKNDDLAAGSVLVIDDKGDTIKALYGDAYSVTNLGDKGVTKLSNNNFVIISSNYTHNEKTNAGIVQLVNSKGEVVKPITGQGLGNNERFGSNGIFPLKNGNFLITSQNYRTGVTFNHAGVITYAGSTIGAIQLIDGSNGDSISLLTGDWGGAYLGRTDGTLTTTIATLGNSNYVVMHDSSSLSRGGGYHSLSSVRLFSGVDGTQVGGAEATIRDGVDGTQYGRKLSRITVLDNDNYVVSIPYAKSQNRIYVGSIRLMDGTNGTQISIKYGDDSADLLGRDDVIKLSNHKYAVSSKHDNNQKGTVMLFNDKGILEATLFTNRKAYSSFFGSLYALGNNNFVITSPDDTSEKGVMSAGSVRLIDGNIADGQGNMKQIKTIYGDDETDVFGSGGVTLLNNHNFVFAAPNDDIGGEEDLGSVQVVNGTTGIANITDKIVGLKKDDMKSAQMIRPTTAGDYFILSQPLADDNGVDAGKIRLVVPTF